MSQQPKEQEFAIQNNVYTLHALQGQIRELEGKAPERRIHIASKDTELEIDIPWQAEVDQGHEIDLVYAVNKDQPEEKKAYYIYDRDTGQIELDDTHPKPNKNMILAVVDFVLVIILGLGAVKLIFPLIQDDFLWGMGIVLALLICIYVLVNLATYSFFYKGDLAQRKAMNQKIKELGRAFHAPSQGT
jgi:hypothetical protein